MSILVVRKISLVIFGDPWRISNIEVAYPPRGAVSDEFSECRIRGQNQSKCLGLGFGMQNHNLVEQWSRYAVPGGPQSWTRRLTGKGKHMSWRRTPRLKIQRQATRISEIISSGMCGTTMFSEWRQKGGDLSGEQLQLRKSESNRSPAAHLKLEVYEP
ncbi:hypothetical protein B0H14DRAFT_2608531 [Mycena olivaceomarginata]|nr:hypothetical protein B0H14DRAFT_2608531 [Mycena olivaceomarginata]